MVQLEPYPGVVEFIKDLATRHPLALVTSSLPSEAKTVLRAFDITGCFQATVTADDITKGKPDPEGYLKGAAALNVDPKDCVVIEDAPSGVRAAKAAGMQCQVVTNTHTKDGLAGADLFAGHLAPGVL